MDKAIAAWEEEGGSAGRITVARLVGTVNQIAWAEQIKAQVDAEFDRLRRVLDSAASARPPKDVTDLQTIIQILEDKRAEVMENDQAGYFIRNWQELRDQVRRLITADPRYEEMRGRIHNRRRPADHEGAA